MIQVSGESIPYLLRCAVGHSSVWHIRLGLLCFPFFTELMFLETSAKTGENVEESFLKCSKTILAKIETGMLYSREDNGQGLKA